LLLAGFIILIYSGKYLVKSSVSIANYFNIPKIFIGLTIVAMGTSAPELLVSINASLTGHPDVAMYNVIGSNISNIAFVLAITAMVYPVAIRSLTLKSNLPVMIGILLVMYVLVLDKELSRLDGFLLFAYLAASVILYYYQARGSDDNHKIQGEKDLNLGLSLILILICSGGLAYGAHLLVDNAIIIARHFGISERIISVTLVAVGTSIPELTTSVIASLRKESDISIGNIIGSNLYNVGFVLGITALIKPISVNPLALGFDIYIMIGISVMLFILFVLPLKFNLSRWKSFFLFSIYLIYLYLILEKIN